MVILTTNDIASFPVNGEWFSSSNEVAKACRMKLLFSWKPQGVFQLWQIPADSLAYFLRYNKTYRETFLSMQLKELDPEMNKKIKAVKHYLEMKREPFEEIYSFSTLSSVFGVPVNQIVSMFCANEPVWKKMIFSNFILSRSYSHSLSIGRIVCYLEKNPVWVDKLYERQQTMLANGEISLENIARHILMLFSYYKSNGYLL